MFQHVRTKRLWVYVLIVALGVVLGSQVAATAPITATAEGQTATALSSEELSATTTEYAFVPYNVGVFSNRIHVRATVFNGSIGYFAVPTTDARFANRLLSLFLTAKASGKRVAVVYNPSDTSGSAWGCQSGDCRTILWAYIID